MQDPARRAMVSKTHTGKIISQQHREAITKKRKGVKHGPMAESTKQKLRELDKTYSTGDNSWWAKLEHKPTVSCLICRREVKFNILGKHQWGSLCKKNSKS